MGGHNHIGVDTQMLMIVAEVETLGDNVARLLSDEARQPLDDTEGDEVESVFLSDSVAGHILLLAIYAAAVRDLAERWRPETLPNGTACWARSPTEALAGGLRPTSVSFTFHFVHP
jgi:hypothetical protein